MAIVGGFDVHRAQITFDYLDTETGKIATGQSCPATRANLRRLYAWATPRTGSHPHRHRSGRCPDELSFDVARSALRSLRRSSPGSRSFVLASGSGRSTLTPAPGASLSSRATDLAIPTRTQVLDPGSLHR